jgi:MFS family permease
LEADLLCAVQFLDVADSSIMNVALPSIRRDLGFSVQGLQWVLSGYLVTYGGLLLLGGRAAVIGLRATNTRGEPVTQPSGTPAVRAQVPAPELTDRPLSARSDPQRQRGGRRGRPVITRTKGET